MSETSGTTELVPSLDGMKDKVTKDSLRYVVEVGPRRIFRRMAGYWEDSYDEVAGWLKRDEYKENRDRLRGRSEDLPESHLAKAVDEFRALDDAKELLFSRSQNVNVDVLQELSNFQYDLGEVGTFLVRYNFVETSGEFKTMTGEVVLGIRKIRHCIACLFALYNASLNILDAKEDGRFTDYLFRYNDMLRKFVGIEDGGGHSKKFDSKKDVDDAVDFLDSRIEELMSIKLAQGRALINESFDLGRNAPEGSAAKELYNKIQDFMQINTGASIDSVSFPYSISGKGLDELFDPSGFDDEELEEIKYLWTMRFLLRPDYLYAEALSEEKVA